MSRFDQRGSASLWLVAATMVAVVGVSAIAHVASAGLQRSRRSAAADLVALACVDDGPSAAAAIAREHHVRVGFLSRTEAAASERSNGAASSKEAVVPAQSAGPSVSCVVEIVDSTGTRQRTRAVR